MSDFIGQNPRFINADLVYLETARAQVQAAIGAIEALKEKAILRDTQGALSDLIDGLIDSKGDLNGIILKAEDAATYRTAAE